MMWCYCHHLHSLMEILREFTTEDNFNNTFFDKSPSAHRCGAELGQRYGLVGKMPNLCLKKH